MPKGYFFRYDHTRTDNVPEPEERSDYATFAVSLYGTYGKDGWNEYYNGNRARTTAAEDVFSGLFAAGVPVF